VLRFGEVLAFGLVGNACIPAIRSSVEQLLASGIYVTCGLIPKARFKFEQSLLVMINIHMAFNAGRGSFGPGCGSERVSTPRNVLSGISRATALRVPQTHRCAHSLGRRGPTLQFRVSAEERGYCGHDVKSG